MAAISPARYSTGANVKDKGSCDHKNILLDEMRVSRIFLYLPEKIFSAMKKYAPLALLFVLIITSCSQMKKQADLILTNGKVYTVDSSFTMASAIAVRDKKIAAVGSDQQILENYKADQTIDLQGRPVYPGFIDAHCHFYGYSMNLRQVDLVGTGSFQEILEALRQYDRQHQTEWIVGRGWDQNDWPVTKYPSKEALDEVFPDKPVFLTRIDGHAALANSLALRKAGIDGTTTVEGGKVIKKGGQPTGVLIDNAMSLVSKLIPEPTREEKISALQKGADNCYGVGLTSIADAGLGHEPIELMDSLQQAGKMKMQTYVMLSPTEKNFEKYMEKGRYRTPYMHIESIKLFADGALGSRGACLLESYSDDPGNRGFLVTPGEELRKYAQMAYKQDYQVNTHAIGDSANRVMLEIYGEILQKDNDRRWRIEHAQIIHPDDFSMFGKYSIIPAVNTTHATSDMYWADERLGKNRLQHAYAYRQLLEENSWLPNGSDFPVEHINPLYGFYAAVARQDLEGHPEDGFQPENALNHRQALRAMTIWAARSMFEEDEKGSIEAGKKADLVVTDRDIMEIPIDKVPEVRVVRTLLQGEEVYHAEKQE